MSLIIDYFLHRSLFVNLLTFLLVISGLWTILNTNREAFPQVEYDIVSIVTIWPGASSQDIEKLITNPFERSIKGVGGIRKYRSSSIEGRSSISVTIDPDVDDTQKVIDDIRNAIDNTKDIPDDTEEPSIIEITTSTIPVIQWSLARVKDKKGNYQTSYKELRDLAEILENKISDLSDVARVEKRGWRDAEIFIDLNPQAMIRYQIGGNDVVRVLKARNITLPGGDMQIGKEEILLRTVGEFRSTQEIKKVPVRANDIGASVRVQDLAKVYEDFSEPMYLETTEGNSAISLTVVKRESGDIINVVNDTKKIAKEFERTLPADVKIVSSNDISFFVRRRLGVLLSNATLGLCFVVGILFIFLGWRTALMVALGIPISFAIAFLFMSYLGMSLNMISMFAMIIVLGIIVDDAIIVSENFYRYLEMGYPPLEAASRGTKEVIAPVLATIATTISTFGPLLFLSGIFGKFVFTIPLVIIICLIGSLLECFFILPSHIHDINRNTDSEKLKSMQNRFSWFARFRDKFYLPSLKYVLTHKIIVLASFFGMVLLSILLQTLFGKFSLFPSAIDALYIKLEGKPETTKEEMNRVVQAVGHVVNRLPDSELDTYIGRAGIQSQEGPDPFAKYGGNYAMILVFLHQEIDRKYSADTIADVLRNQTEWLLTPASLAEKKEQDKNKIIRLKKQHKSIAAFTKTKNIISPGFKDLGGSLTSLSFGYQKGGPPVGKPISIEVIDNDFQILKSLSNEYKSILKKISGVQDIGSDFLPGKKELQLNVNEALLAQAGVSVLDIATALNTAFEGTVATSIRRSDEEVDVRVRFAEKHRNSLQALQNIYLTNSQGQLIPASRMINFKEAKSITSINHLNGRRIINITANIDESLITSAKANQLVVIESEKRKLDKKYPSHTVNYGGENEDTQESLAGLKFLFLIGILIIFMILAALFRSLVQPFIILTAIPFAMIGVILALVFHGIPFGFLAFVGMIGLSGVVVNDSIVLLDFANRMKTNHPEWTNQELAIQAASQRLRPVLLTTLTTAAGLLPTAYGLGGYDPFLVPMALSFAWGLIFSTVLILGLVPLLYVLVLDFQDWRSRFVWRKIPSIHS